MKSVYKNDNDLFYIKYNESPAKWIAIKKFERFVVNPVFGVIFVRFERLLFGAAIFYGIRDWKSAMIYVARAFIKNVYFNQNSGLFFALS